MRHLRKFMAILEMILLYFEKVMKLLLVMLARILLKAELVMMLLTVGLVLILQFLKMYHPLIL